MYLRAYVFAKFLQYFIEIRSAPASECSVIVVCTLIGCCRSKNVFWPRHQNKQIGSFDVSKTHTIYGHLLTFYGFSVTVNIYIKIVGKIHCGNPIKIKVYRKQVEPNCTIVNITTADYSYNEWNENEWMLYYFCPNKRVAKTSCAETTMHFNSKWVLLDTKRFRQWDSR